MAGRAGASAWTDERIIAALHDWTAELGSPPLSYEWSPATARSLGMANERVARWERDWPRWPSADTLRWHFGRWSTALQAAGLPVRALVFDMPLPERVEAARRLARAGESRAAIADHLGVHVATVRAYLRARACLDCGLPVVSTAARRCLACALARSRGRTWTREEIAEAINDWVAEVGEPPSATAWNPGPDRAKKWLDEWPRWPSGPLVRRRFGSWRAAVEASGHKPRHHPASADEVVAALRRDARRLGRPPRQSEWSTADPTRPDSSAVARRFGSWNAGLRAAGLTPVRRRWEGDDIVAALRDWTAENGQPPLSGDWRQASAEHPSSSAVRRHFGSWQAAIEAAAPTPGAPA
jgi:Homing endonuclease associated repeat